ncbi:MAG: SH3 domain-containing protein [Lachnospiraceae bacterium]|nr:SH3 domain-containing protein [Lachnospiraceae bacterium]
MRYLGEKDRRRNSRIKAAVFGLLCIAVLALLPARDVLAVEGTVTASSANIRAGADPNSQILASVLNGDKLTIKEEVTGTDGNVWFYVFIDSDRLGYVRSDLVKKDDGSAASATSTFTPTTTPASTPTPAATPASSNNSQINSNVTVNRDGVEEVQPVSASVNSTTPVRVRADSSTDADIVTTVKKDVVLTVHGKKTAGNGDLWYLVSFMVNNAEVNGYVHSNYVTLGGELLPVEPETPAEPETPVDPPAPAEPVVQENDWYTKQGDDGKWYLVENATGKGTPIEDMFTNWNKAVDDLEAAQSKVSKQTAVIVILSILLVVLALGITLLIFKIKDMTEDDGFDMQRTPVRRSGDRPARPTGSAGASQTRPAGNRPAGARPAAQAGTAGSRPAGARPASSQGGRPAGARPASSQGGRPAGAARPDGTRPASSQGSRPAGAARPDGTRPAQPAGARPAAGTQAGTAGSRPVSSADGDNLERQARADVEARNLERNTAAAQPKKPRNFMSDDDEFEFEFLNWDGDGEA